MDMTLLEITTTEQILSRQALIPRTVVTATALMLQVMNAPDLYATLFECTKCSDFKGIIGANDPTNGFLGVAPDGKPMINNSAHYFHSLNFNVL